MVAFDIKRTEAYPYPKILKKKMENTVSLFGIVPSLIAIEIDTAKRKFRTNGQSVYRKMSPDLHVHLASHPPELYDHG